MKKIFLLVGLSLLVPTMVLAALRAPVQLSPLQPIPQDTAPNVNTNVNTPGNEYNTNQEEIQNQQSFENTDTPQPDEPEQTNPVTGSDVTSSSALYWFLLFAGLIGIVGAGIWAYVRFFRKA